jgi:rhodanese-related sulfurtransferase
MKNVLSQAQTSIAPSDLQRRLAGGGPARLVDVRTPGEFAAGHVPGARLVPLDDLNPAAFRDSGGDGGPIYVLCQSGQRARKAIAKLGEAGVDNCVLVEGGTQAWMDAGLPVERSQHGGLPLMRQVQIVVGSVTAAGGILALTVNPYFAVAPLVMGCGLLFAGVTGICGLALLLAKMPWNRLKDRGDACGCAGGAS